MKTYNRVKVTLGSTGFFDLVLAEPLDGFQTFAEAGVPGWAVVSYVIEDGDQWEVGTGQYDPVNVKLIARTPQQSSNEGDPIEVSATAILYLTPNAADYAALAGSALVQVFDVSGTWVKPEGAKMIYILAICGGGGGGSGGVAPVGTICAGGAGGGGGAFTEATHDAASMPPSLSVIVGGGGAGGASVTDGAGNPGAPGGYSWVERFGVVYSFTAILAAGGGQAGAPGVSQVFAGAGGGSTLYHTVPGGPGGQGQTVNSGGAGFTTQRGTFGGSGGGGLDAAATPRPGKDGYPGPVIIYGNLGLITGIRSTGGVAPGGNAAAAPAPKTATVVGGAGGGGASNTGGGSGGAGAAGTVGGGGGGGGSCSTGGTSGAGGNGGPGRVVIVTYF